MGNVTLIVYYVIFKCYVILVVLCDSFCHCFFC